MRYILSVVLILVSLFWSGCSDDAVVIVFDKTITNEKIPCLALFIPKPDLQVEGTLRSLYHFDKDCAWKLEVTKKDSIVCNSTQNVQKKALAHFPSSYLKMQIKKDDQLKYSYYIDLDESLTQEDVVQGFQRIKKDLILF